MSENDNTGSHPAECIHCAIHEFFRRHAEAGHPIDANIELRLIMLAVGELCEMILDKADRQEAVRISFLSLARFTNTKATSLKGEQVDAALAAADMPPKSERH